MDLIVTGVDDELDGLSPSAMRATIGRSLETLPAAEAAADELPGTAPPGEGRR